MKRDLADPVSSTLRTGAAQNGTAQRLLGWWMLLGGVRGALLAALPLVLLVVSPQRVAASVIVALLYLGAALVLVKPRADDRAPFVYAVVAAAFMALMLVRMETIDPLDAAQRAYGLDKGSYFIAAILPLAAATALLVSRLDDLRPLAVAFIVVGLIVAVLTLGLRNGNLFGEPRYTSVGNLIAGAAVLLFQFWIVRNFRIGAGLGLLALVAILPTESKQSLVAVGVALVVTAIYWFAADRHRVASGKPAVFGALWKVPVAIVAAVVVVAGVWLLIVVLASAVPLPLPVTITNPIACECMGGRFYSLLFNLGDRNVLIADAWRLFTSHPLFGAGLGAFVGFSEAGYRYPHNVPLELLAETGLAGALLLLTPLVVAWFRLARAGIRAASPAVASAIMIVLVYAVVANLSGDIPSARGLWVFGLVMLKLGLKADPAEVRG